MNKYILYARARASTQKQRPFYQVFFKVSCETESFCAADNDLWAIPGAMEKCFLRNCHLGGSTFFYRRAHILITIASPGKFQRQTHRLLHSAEEQFVLSVETLKSFIRRPAKSDGKGN